MTIRREMKRPPFAAGGGGKEMTPTRSADKFTTGHPKLVYRTLGKDRMRKPRPGVLEIWLPPERPWIDLEELGRALDLYQFYAGGTR